MSRYNGYANNTINPDNFSSPILKEMAMKYNYDIVRNTNTNTNTNSSNRNNILYNSNSTIIRDNQTSTGVCMSHVYYGCQPGITTIIG
jgi:hypothetical protein